MTPEQFKHHLLRELYHSWSDGSAPGEFNVRDFIEQKQLDQEWIWQIVRHIEQEDFLRFITVTTVGSTTSGLIWAEESGVVVPELVKENRQLQEEFLIALRTHETANTEPLSFEIGSFCKAHKIDERKFWNISDLLGDMALLTQRGTEPPELTAAGRQAADEVILSRSRLQRFLQVEKLLPNPRGLKFQELVGDVLGEEGWRAEPSRRSPGEEVDVVLSRGAEYYLVECRWLVNPVQPKEFRDFLGKLMKRPAMVIGCFISMSGFTENAIREEVRANFGNRVILCFGPNDVRNWMIGKLSFHELLEKKIRATYTRREVLFE